jgi:hypothetical protein
LRAQSPSNAPTRQSRPASVDPSFPEFKMSDEQRASSLPPSINDSLPNGNPSGKTVLIALGGLALGFCMLLLYAEFFK